MNSNSENYFDPVADPVFQSAFPVPSLNPVNFLRAHHCFQVSLCRHLESLSTDLSYPRAPEFAGMALCYLQEVFPLHHEYEENDLWEALDSQPDFGTDESTLFDLMTEAHRRDEELAVPVMEGLSRIAMGGYPENPAAFVIALLLFAGSLRRNINWEDSVIMPLAAEELRPAAKASESANTD